MEMLISLMTPACALLHVYLIIKFFIYSENQFPGVACHPISRNAHTSLTRGYRLHPALETPHHTVFSGPLKMSLQFSCFSPLPEYYMFFKLFFK